LLALRCPGRCADLDSALRRRDGDPVTVIELPPDGGWGAVVVRTAVPHEVGDALVNSRRCRPARPRPARFQAPRVAAAEQARALALDLANRRATVSPAVAGGTRAASSLAASAGSSTSVVMREVCCVINASTRSFHLGERQRSDRIDEAGENRPAACGSHGDVGDEIAPPSPRAMRSRSVIVLRQHEGALPSPYSG